MVPVQPRLEHDDVDRRRSTSTLLFNQLLTNYWFKIKLFSFSSDKDRRTDSRIRRKKHSAAPPGIEPRILRILVARFWFKVFIWFMEVLSVKPACSYVGGKRMILPTA